jgi:hypothetical protein
MLGHGRSGQTRPGALRLGSRGFVHERPSTGPRPSATRGAVSLFPLITPCQGESGWLSVTWRERPRTEDTKSDVRASFVCVQGTLRRVS